MEDELLKLAEKIIHTATDKNITLTTAESCTGGQVACLLTAIPGAGVVFDRGFVTYSYEAKTEMLGVSKNLLLNYGAVSTECVEEMVIGAVRNSHAQLAVAISGVAGPTGGSESKPVGTVYFASFDKINNKLKSEKKDFQGDRIEVTKSSARRALELFQLMLNEH